MRTHRPIRQLTEAEGRSSWPDYPISVTKADVGSRADVEPNDFYDVEEPNDKFSAGNVYYCPDDDTVFLTKRSGVMHNPYLWDIPGGRSDKGEKVDETARREAEEELSRLPKYAVPITSHTLTWDKDGKPYNYHLFLYAVPESEKVRWTPRIFLDKETAGFKWFKLDDIPTGDDMHLDLSWVEPAVHSIRNKKSLGESTERSRARLLSYEAFKPRHEDKYWVTRETMEAILEYAALALEPDHHGIVYRVNNIYLDTNEFELYQEHMRGTPTHFKLRMRTYNDDFNGNIFLEVKEKSFGTCNKNRNVFPARECSRLIERRDANVPFIQLVKTLGTEPILRLDYVREAYNLLGTDARLTFDTDARYERQQGGGFVGSPSNSLFESDLCIMEMKYNGDRPTAMTDIVERFGLKRSSISKYCLSVHDMQSR